MPELICQKVDDHYLLRDGASGIFLAASQFPKNRETRAPLVKELLPHANELDPKFNYLLDAPLEDPDGLPSVIRYSRKTKEQYVQSEVEGKATGWRAYYTNGRWVEQAKPPPKAKKKAKAKKKPKAKKKARATNATQQPSEK
jgi:DNA topoisomerase-1